MIPTRYLLATIIAVVNPGGVDADADPNSSASSPLAVTDAVLLASRALVGVAARALAAQDLDVSLPQFRVLVVLAGGGALPSSTLADQLGVSPSTITRMIDRLVSKDLVARLAAPQDRRQVHVTLTTSGQQLMQQVTRHRRAAIEQILRRMPTPELAHLLPALQAFAAAAGDDLLHAAPSPAEHVPLDVTRR